MKRFLLGMLLTVLFSCPALADTREYPNYVEGEVLVIIAAPAFDDYEDMSAYSEAIFQQGKAFAEEYGLEFLNAYPTLAKMSGKNIIFLCSEHKSTDELIRELSSVPGVESVSRNNIRSADENESGGCNVGYYNILLLVGLILRSRK